jgi:DNA-binding response OmpR family regulator
MVILMMTTESSPEIKRKGKALGVKAWINKPYLVSTLLAVLKEVLK